MKKFLLILLAILMCLSVVGCENSGNINPDTSKTDSEATSEEPDKELSGTNSSEAPENSDSPETSEENFDETPDDFFENPEISTEHEFEAVKRTEVEPTCNMQGYFVLECHCGDIKKEPSGKPAFGHSWDEGKKEVTSQTSCGDVGTITYTCKTCKQTKVVDISANHAYGEVQYREWKQTHNLTGTDFQATFREKYQQCAKCTHKKVIVAGHYCDEGIKGQNKLEIITKGTCEKPGMNRETCSVCGYYWDIETGFEDCDYEETMKKLTDYTAWTNEIFARISTCKNCGDVIGGNRMNGYLFGQVNEGTIDAYGWSTDKWKPIYHIDFKQGDAYAPMQYFSETFYKDEHPEYQSVIRNIKYNSEGYIIELEYRWHGKDGTRYSEVLNLYDVPQIFKDAGYYLDEYQDEDLKRFHFSFEVKGGKLVPSSILFIS